MRIKPGAPRRECKMKKEEKRDAVVAAAVTMIIVALLLCVLFFCGLRWAREALAAASIPETGQEEEIFLSPELVRDAGEDESPFQDTPAPQQQGEDKAGDAPERPAVSQTALATERPAETKMKRSELHQTTPSKTESEREKREKDAAAANVRKGFAKGGASAGSGGAGAGVDGHAPGRKFLGCTLPDVALKQKTTVRVDVSVNAAGKVTWAKARTGGNAAIRRACEAAARTARWSEKSGAPDTPGSITFTITPR